MARRHDSGFTALRIEGGLLPSEFLLTVARGEAGDQDNAAYGLTRSLNLRDEIGRFFRIATDLYIDFRARPDDPHAAVDRWLAPLLTQVFGYRALQPLDAPLEIAERRFPVTHQAQGGAVPLVLVPPAFGLDAANERFGEEGRRRTPMGLLQELLNASDDHLWGLVSDGRVLRLLRKNPSFTRPAWIELDLERVFEDRIYADFAAFWMLAHGTRLEPREAGNPATCVLERWRHKAVQTGERAKGELRKGVAHALLTLGRGFVRHKDNDRLRQRLASGAVTADRLHQELLRLVYRCLFLFVVEDRGLLHPPGTPPEAEQLWAEGYGIGQLRARSLRPRLHDVHGDLWQGVLITFMALERGEPAIGAPALGGLFQRQLCAELFTCALDNASLLEAIRALAFFRPDRAKALTRVNYRDLGTEELGSVYESLLELHPVVEREPWGFSYVGLNGDGVRGSERKLSGSYYTPDSLVQELIKSALEPVIRRTATEHPYDQRRALLDLRIVDPACGSGHFLLAAARRLAYEIARIDAAPDAPTEAQRQHALREVVQRCVYGVDKNPLAVELCKTALWIETVEPGKPLSFLDHRIREGDSLIGVLDLAVLEDGIPDGAYKPKSGDDKGYARELGAQNKAERERPLLRRSVGGDLEALAGDLADLAAMPEDAPAEVDAKARRFRELAAAERRRRLEVAANLWTAAFFASLHRREGQPARVPTTLDVWKALAQPGGTQGPRPGDAQDLAAANSFFHWPVEFPEVIAKGGFDVVLGNPPWERIKLQEQEFFAARHEGIAQSPNKAARERLIKALATSDNPIERKLHCDFQRALNAAEAQSLFMRGSGRFPLAAVGDVNTYALFAELFLRLVSEQGRAGVIVPLGIATDDTTKRFFGHLIVAAKLASLLAFENEEFIFAGVHNATRFALLTLRGDGRGAEPEFAFFCRQVAHLADKRRRFTLASEDIALINPNTRTCPIFRTGVDAELTKKIYRRVPVLTDESKGDAGNPWGIRFMAMFHMANDSGLFVTTQELLDGSPLPNEPKKSLILHIYGVAHERGMAPLYEAKMIHHFDHRSTTYLGVDQRPGAGRDLPRPSREQYNDPGFLAVPYYWVPASSVEERLAAKGWKRAWLMGWRDTSASTGERTIIATAIPRVAVGDKFLLMLPSVDDRLCAALLANLCSLVFDFVARQKVGGASVKYFTMKQLVALPPSAYTPDDLDFIAPRVLKLTYTAWDMQPFARDLGQDGPPVAWDPERRAVLRAELDAYYAWLYGLTRDELRYVLDPKEVMGEDFPSESFRVLKANEERPPPRGFGQYRTRRLVLDAFDRFHEDGTFDPARSRDPHYLPQVQKAYGEMKARFEASERERSELELLYRRLLARADEARQPVLFVEGASDVPVIEAAWAAFHPGEPMPFAILPAGGTLQMRSLAGRGGALRQVLRDMLVMALADNDGAGRSLSDDSGFRKLRSGGVWGRLDNGIWWCLLQPSDEFKAVMTRFGIPPINWPCTVEQCFSAALRRQAAAEGVYAVGNKLCPDLLVNLSDRISDPLWELDPTDDAYWYVRAPTPAAKEPFAAWITAPERRTPEIYASFRAIMEGLRQLLERHAAEAGRQARLL